MGAFGAFFMDISIVFKLFGYEILGFQGVIDV